MKVRIMITPDPEAQKKVLEDLIKKHKTVTVSKDEKGTLFAEVSEEKEKQLEIHPTTGLPILLD